MIRAFYNAASGMKAQQMSTDVISNNIANVNTPGYKKIRASFQDALYDIMERRPDQQLINLQTGSGVRSGINQMLSGQGALTPTNRKLDFAIQGDGFFWVRGSQNQVYYTRKGDFQLAPLGGGISQLQTSEGMPVLDIYGNPIQFDAAINEENLRIDGDRRIYIRDDQGIWQAHGQLGISTFINPSGLQKVGSGLFIETAASGAPSIQNIGAVVQGSLERSNVEIAEEMTGLILAQRAYQLNSRVLQTADQMEGLANNLRR